MLVLGFEEIKEVKGSYLSGWKFDLFWVLGKLFLRNGNLDQEMPERMAGLDRCGRPNIII